MKALKNLAVVFFTVSALFFFSCEEGEVVVPINDSTDVAINNDSVMARVNDSLTYWASLEDGKISWGSIHEFVESPVDPETGEFETVKGKRTVEELMNQRIKKSTNKDTLVLMRPMLEMKDETQIQGVMILEFYFITKDSIEIVNNYLTKKGQNISNNVGTNNFLFSVDTSNFSWFKPNYGNVNFKLSDVNFKEYYIKAERFKNYVFFVNPDSLGIEYNMSGPTDERYSNTVENFDKVWNYCYENELYYPIHDNFKIY